MGDEREIEPRLLAAGKVARAHEYLLLAEAEAGQPRPDGLGARLRHEPREMIEGAAGGIYLLDLVLREKPAQQPRRPCATSGHRAAESGLQPAQAALLLALVAP